MGRLLSRKAYIAGVFLLLLVSLACGDVSDSQQFSNSAGVNTDPPLIYILTIDALRADVIDRSLNGQPVMPKLRAFAEESVTFEYAMAQAPFTKISVASLFTGLWPSRLGVKNCRLWIFPRGVELCRGLDTRFHTVAEYLAGRGYHTVTSLFTAHVRQGDGLIQGFITQEPQLPEELPAGKAFVYNHVLGLHAPYQPSDEALDALGIQRPPESNLTGTDWYWEPLTEAQGEGLWQLYLAEGWDWDQRFGELRDELISKGRWDDALFIVTADHGEEFLEHGNTQHSVQLYDEVLRVPLLIKFPAKSSWARLHGSKFSHRVRLVDLFPTIAHLLDGSAPTSFDGESLLPILEGQERDERRRPSLAFTSVSRDFEGRAMSFESQAIASGTSKAIWGYLAEDSQLAETFSHRRGDEITRFFDLAEDPGERQDLSAEQTELFVQLQQQYEQLLTLPKPGASGVPSVVAMPAPGTESEQERLEREKQLRSLGYIP